MLALYLAAFGFGTTMILVSLLFGGGDKDFDKDLDHDPGHDHDHDHEKGGPQHTLDRPNGFSAWCTPWAATWTRSQVVMAS